MTPWEAVQAIAAATTIVFVAACVPFSYRSWLGWLNFIVLQWMFVRLARVTGSDGRRLGYTLLRWPVPMSGWWGRYWWLRRTWPPSTSTRSQERRG